MFVSKNIAEAGAGPAAFQTANTDLKEKLHQRRAIDLSFRLHHMPPTQSETTDMKL